MLDRRTFVTAGAALGAGALAGGVVPAEAAAAPPASQDFKLSRTLRDGVITQSYFIAKPVAQVWHAYTNPAERKIWFGIEQDQLKDAVEVRPPNYFKIKLDHPGLPGPTTVSASFEAMPGGTRVTRTFAGFGDTPIWQNAMHSAADGVDEDMSDLALYLHTGVGFPRHTGRGFGTRPPHPNDLRFGTRNVPGGVEILEVQPGSFVAEAGLQPGDIVVALGDGGIFDMRDPRLANWMFPLGDVVQVTWIRGKQVMRGKAKMTYAEPKWRNGFDPRAPRPGG